MIDPPRSHKASTIRNHNKQNNNLKQQTRDAIARTWPASIDDSAARRDWGWRLALGTDELVAAMLDALAPAYEAKKAAEAGAAAGGGGSGGAAQARPAAAAAA